MLPLRMSRLIDGVSTSLATNPTINNIFGRDFQGGHASCRNWKLPGWVYVSHGRGNREIYAFKLDSSNTARRFTNGHGESDTYDAETHASPSPDGTIFMFKSDWGTSPLEINSYIAGKQL